MAGLLIDLPPHCFCCCCWVSGEGGGVYWPRIRNHMVTMHVMNHDVPFHAARAESAAAPFSLAPLAAHRHRCLLPASEVSPLCVTRIKRNTPKNVMAGNKTPGLSLPRTVAFAAARQRTQCHYCRCVHRRRCFFPASKKKDTCQATTIPYHTLMHMLFCARYRLQLHISARKPPGTKSL